MSKKNHVVNLILSVMVCCMYESGNCQIASEKQQIGADAGGDLIKLYEQLKEQKRGNNIEIYYRQETIIKESVQQDEYLKHLLQELRRSLEKGKKWGTVSRVEGNLVEIDKGAVHKIHERDVYGVYDSSGGYKGKIEVDAIADAIAIGTSYAQKKKIDPGDVVKFRGQRKLFELGLIYGSNKDQRDSGYGMIWKYTFRSGWGVEALMIDFKRIIEQEESVLDFYTGRYDINFSAGARKYFYHPFWVTPFMGVGGSYMRIEYSHYGSEHALVSETKIVPYFIVGAQMSLQQLHLDLEGRYFYGPKLNVEPEPIKIRPTIYCASISFTW